MFTSPHIKDCGFLVYSSYSICAFNSSPQPREMGRMCVHKRQNVQAALECLERHHVRLEGITSDHIADGNQKLILGLVWTVIFHFQLLIGNDDQVYQAQWKVKSDLLRWAQIAVKP